MILLHKINSITRLIIPKWPIYSVYSSDFVNGNLYDRIVPFDVPTNKDLPVWLSAIDVGWKSSGMTWTSRRICFKKKTRINL